MTPRKGTGPAAHRAQVKRTTFNRNDSPARVECQVRSKPRPRPILRRAWPEPHRSHLADLQHRIEDAEAAGDRVLFFLLLAAKNDYARRHACQGVGA